LAGGEEGGSGSSSGGPPSPFAYAGLGFELALPLVLLMYGGYKLDAWLGTEPGFTVAGALVGMALGFYGLYRRFARPPGDGTR
jgi:Putative F0F1-ATPase subunit Ca2+/Mg2+ transporter